MILYIHLHPFNYENLLSRALLSMLRTYQGTKTDKDPCPERVSVLTEKDRQKKNWLNK